MHCENCLYDVLLLLLVVTYASLPGQSVSLIARWRQRASGHARIRLISDSIKNQDSRPAGTYIAQHARCDER